MAFSRAASVRCLGHGPTLTYLAAPDAPVAVDWYKRALGATEFVEPCRVIEHLDALTRKYTRHPAYYGYVYPVEQRGREMRVICRIHARRVTLAAIHT